jgi:hypothetical protein
MLSFQPAQRSGPFAAKALMTLDNSSPDCVRQRLTTVGEVRGTRGIALHRYPHNRQMTIRGNMDTSAVLQTYLDEMSCFVMHERFEEYAARVRLPLVIRTSVACLTVTTLRDLEEGFDDFIEMMRSRGVTTLQRRVQEAAADGPDGITGTYETRLLAGDRDAMPSFRSRMWLVRAGEVWQATRIHNSTTDARWPILMADDPSQLPDTGA